MSTVIASGLARGGAAAQPGGPGGPLPTILPTFIMGGFVVDVGPSEPWNLPKIPGDAWARARGRVTMDNEVLLREIAGYCRRVGMAESTFGRLAVNDGKLVSRLRFGGRVTLGTVERVHSFIEHHRPSARRRPAHSGNGAAASLAPVGAAAPDAGADRDFRFYDNRQKYLLF